MFKYVNFLVILAYVAARPMHSAFIGLLGFGLSFMNTLGSTILSATEVTSSCRNTIDYMS